MKLKRQKHIPLGDICRSWAVNEIGSIPSRSEATVLCVFTFYSFETTIQSKYRKQKFLKYLPQMVQEKKLQMLILLLINIASYFLTYTNFKFSTLTTGVTVAETKASALSFLTPVSIPRIKYWPTFESLIKTMSPSFAFEIEGKFSILISYSFPTAIAFPKLLRAFCANWSAVRFVAILVTIVIDIELPILLGIFSFK